MLEFLPLLLTLTLALLLRRTLVALGAGVLCGALILNDFDPWTSAAYLFSGFTGLFYHQAQWQGWHLNVLAAMLLLGVMTSLLGRSGAVEQFGLWLSRRISDGRQARLGVVGLGFLVFIDGIFSCLAVGSVGRPLAKHYGISANRLAYMVDTTASPLCSLVPVASWGPYVMALLAGVTFLPVSPLEAFLGMAVVNFYAIGALLLVLVGTWLDWGWTTEAESAGDASLPKDISASPWPLLLPLAALLLSSVGFTLYSGSRLTTESGLGAMLTAADIGAAMRDASVLAVLVAMAGSLWRGRGKALGADVLVGVRSMALAVGILLLTWMIGQLIKDLGAGFRIANLARDWLSADYMLAGIFGLCAVMAFATGTSWGTFAIMIPLCAQVAHTLAPTLLLPALAAVMAGSVFGDHCSPISDTSILSATASGASVQGHVTTQLPFALMAAAAAILAFQGLNMGLPHGVVLALMALTAVTLLWMWQRRLKASGGAE
ncbi:Na+/H+ antiporter NhaC family protein [Shewanella sp.]|uniref:Na+/H+ antiporter NhaC family protein n=1 Tax=Shewanella sp. TaxID=50422 RepID=UPI0035668E0E